MWVNERKPLMYLNNKDSRCDSWSQQWGDQASAASCLLWPHWMCPVPGGDWHCPWVIRSEHSGHPVWGVGNCFHQRNTKKACGFVWCIGLIPQEISGTWLPWGLEISDLAGILSLSLQWEGGFGDRGRYIYIYVTRSAKIVRVKSWGFSFCLWSPTHEASQKGS